MTLRIWLHEGHDGEPAETAALRCGMAALGLILGGPALAGLVPAGGSRLLGQERS